MAGPQGRTPPSPLTALSRLSRLPQRAEYGLYRAGDLVARVFPTAVATAIARASRPGLARVYRSREDMTTMARNHLRKVEKLVRTWVDFVKEPDPAGDFISFPLKKPG